MSAPENQAKASKVAATAMHNLETGGIGRPQLGLFEIQDDCGQLAFFNLGCSDHP